MVKSAESSQYNYQNDVIVAKLSGGGQLEIVNYVKALTFIKILPKL